MNAKKLLTYLDKLEREPNLKVNGNTYTLEQVKLAKKITADIEIELGVKPSKPKLSRRRAFIQKGAILSRKLSVPVFSNCPGSRIP